MTGRQCYHCKQWIDDGEAHDCWTTTEAALTRELSEDLRDAWERLRETAVEFGEQRIYASHSSIMFSRKSCYFFVRPKRRFLEVCLFLGRAVQAPQVRRIDRTSQTKMAHILQITHRDQVEAPITDWLREAYDLSDVLAQQAAAKTVAKRAGSKAAPAPARRASKKKKIAPKTSPGQTAAARAVERQRTLQAPSTGNAARKAVRKAVQKTVHKTADKTAQKTVRTSAAAGTRKRSRKTSGKRSR